MSRLNLILALVLFPVMVCAQKVVNVRHGSPDFKTIVKLATSKVQSDIDFPVRLPGNSVQRCGDWVFFQSAIVPLNPKHVGDGDAFALLHKVKGRWKVIDWTIGGVVPEELAQEWQKKYKFPKALAK